MIDACFRLGGSSVRLHERWAALGGSVGQQMDRGEHLGTVVKGCRGGCHCRKEEFMHVIWGAECYFRFLSTKG